MSHIKYHKHNKKKYQTKRITSIVGEEFEKDYKKQMEELHQLHIQSLSTIDKSKNIIIASQDKEDGYKLYLIIGDSIKNNHQEFNSISLYIKDENNNPRLYANIELPYLINHSTFLDIEDDPRYIFKENYDSKAKCYSYACMLKPFKDLKGIYRIMDVELIKIRDIEPLIDEETTNNLIKKIKKY